MTEPKTTAPQALSDDTMDTISGGPHWSTLDDYPSYRTDPEAEAETGQTGHYTQMVWANTR